MLFLAILLGACIEILLGKLIIGRIPLRETDWQLIFSLRCCMIPYVAPAILYARLNIKAYVTVIAAVILVNMTRLSIWIITSDPGAEWKHDIFFWGGLTTAYIAVVIGASVCRMGKL